MIKHFINETSSFSWGRQSKVNQSKSFHYLEPPVNGENLVVETFTLYGQEAVDKHMADIRKKSQEISSNFPSN